MGISESSISKLGRMLIVDDETELVRALCEMLAEQGYEATGFSSGVEALEVLKEKDFDLLLTDLMMPAMDGIELLKAALEAAPHLLGIIMTGQGTIQTAVEAMKVGAFDYVLKPFKLNVILPVLSRAMEVRRLRMENVQLKEAVTIYELSKTISLTLDRDMVLNKVADGALEQCEADEVSIMLPTQEGDELYVAIVRGDNKDQILGQRVSIQEGITGWAARHRETLTLQGEVNDPRFAPVKPRPEIHSAIVVPMLVGGKLIGVLNVNATLRRRAFTSGQAKSLNILAATAASALENTSSYTQVREAEEKHRSIFENATEGIFQTTPEGKFITANPELARMLDYESPQELIAGLTDIEKQLYVEPGKRSEYQRNMEENGIVQGFETQFYRKDDRVIWTSTNARAVYDQNKTLLFYEGTVEDITERKRAEGQVQQSLKRIMALRNIDMAITASLDLRLTLNVILDQTTTQLGVDAADILLLDSNTHKLEYAAGRGFRTDALRYTQLRLGEGHAGSAALERNIVSISNLPKEAGDLKGAPLLADEGFIAYYGVPLIAKGEVEGVLEVFHRAPLDPDREWMDFLETLCGQAAIAIDSAEMFEGLQRSNIELTLAYDVTLEGWSRALDLRDNETEGHTQRVMEMTMSLAGMVGLKDDELIHIRRGALLHDMGKMGIPDNILLKPGKLSEEEWEIMRRHPEYAHNMLSPISYLRPALDIPFCHHEKWDGTGYPRKLGGEAIPLSARIFSVVDVWDALRSDRPYRDGWPAQKVQEHIQSLSGTQFDPQVVEMFLEVEL